MEARITAPADGEVSSVFAQVNTQVKAGAPLVALRAAAGQHAAGRWAWAARGGRRVRRPGRTVRGVQDEADIDHLLRAYLLGYDIEDGDAHELSRERGKRLTGVPSGDEGALRGDQELLEIFADVAALSRRVPEDGEEEEHPRSSHEHLLTYLSFLDRSAAGYPAISRGGCDGPRPVRHPVNGAHAELEQALLRIFQSVRQAAGRRPDRDRDPGPVAPRLRHPGGHHDRRPARRAHPADRRHRRALPRGLRPGQGRPIRLRRRARDQPYPGEGVRGDRGQPGRAVRPARARPAARPRGPGRLVPAADARQAPGLVPRRGRDGQVPAA